MQPRDAVDVFLTIGVASLHHANTVTTSCTFLEHGALLSRGYAEDHGFAQTAQYSDNADKKYGIWHDVFTDTVDIHYRAGCKKGPNLYGPVLFELDVGVLLQLPEGSEVLVTKRNPVHWTDGQTDSDRWYLTPEELSDHMRVGDFDQMIVIRTPTERLDFSGDLQIALDDPQRGLLSGVDAFAHAEERLRKAAAAGKTKIAIRKHGCQVGCACVSRYKGYAPDYFELRFI